MEEYLVVVREARHLERHRVVNLVLTRLGQLEGLLGSQDLEDFDRVWPDDLAHEHFVVAEGLVLPLLAVLEVKLLEDVVVAQVHEISLSFRPNLRSVAAAGELDSHELGVIVRPWVVNYDEELGRLPILRDWAVENCVILAAGAPLEPALGVDALLVQK